MLPTKNENESEVVTVRHARVDSINVYDVTEQELAQLARGGDGGLYLNLCLALVSVAVSFLIAVTTASIISNRQFIIFVVVTAIGFLGAIVFGVLWYRNRESVETVVSAIKRRMPQDETADTEGTAEDAVDKQA